MEALEQFKKTLNSHINKALSGNVSLLNFLDDAMISELNKRCKQEHVNVYYFGGIKNCDRFRAIISFNGISNNDFKIIIFKVKYNKKYNIISHRSVLGSLMSLGIKRECIGDIVIDNNQDCYFACTLEISSYIYDNFRFISNFPIELEYYDDIVENVLRYEDKVYFLPSLRLDACIAQVYKISRSEALDIITNGLVFINHINCLNSSHILKENDEISVRHKGKFKVSLISGQSKSGKLAVTLSKRC